MSKRLNPNEMMAEVRHCLIRKYWNMSFTLDSWFFPSDLHPYDASFKYRCKKLYELGLLERDNSAGRWGWRYHIPQTSQEVDSDIEL